ncbi:uncharacterized protein At4g26485-like [Herrania umbratica]|uniref:Uncharacterized protein At4g26485-like n=1 Tax=Herrania umbratica TaxID=108875 RepID=A0A6J1AKQ3_9ROSI|nr:uncharacterized protein At4g26485-like [Herrania umbratica]
MANSDDGAGNWIKHYSSRHKILLVGEGDFSFAACLARSFGSAANMVATSLDSKAKDSDQGVNEVAIKGKERDELMVIGEEVDSVKLACSLRKKLRNATIVEKDEMEMANLDDKGEKWIKHYSSRHEILLVGEGDFSFAACLARSFGSAANMVATSVDSKESIFRLHQNLVQGFLRNASDTLTDRGEVHITRKITHPFSEWKIEKLAKEVGLGLFREEPFWLWDYPGYGNKRGDGDRCDDSFPVGQYTTFKFRKPSVLADQFPGM